VIRRVFDGARQALAHNTPHGPSHEGEVHHAHHHLATLDKSGAGLHAIVLASLALRITNAIDVRLLINKPKRVDWGHVRIKRFERTGIKELLNALARGDAHVMVALWADHQIGLKALAEDGLFALGALRP
jgi:hypothetical protein